MGATSSSSRFSAEHVKTWTDEGAVLIPDFFEPSDIQPVKDEFAALYGDRDPKHGAPVRIDTGEQVGQFNLDQFTHIDNMPFFHAPHLSMLGLHPALIALARAALQTDDVYLYQSHSWAKFTGETDFEQQFHCDFKNHTLLVPSDNISQRTINIMIYISDVDLDTGAISYVPYSSSDPITGRDRPMFVDGHVETQKKLLAVQRRAPGPAGSIFAYGTDVFHRGMNLTRPNGHRYTLTASYKAKGNDMIGYTAWPYHFLQPWYYIFDTASPDQLSCLGVPLPGDPYWTKRTLACAKERYPNWDLSAYENSL